MKKLIVANWKSYVGSEADALSLAEGYSGIVMPQGVEAVACPPSVYIETVKGKLGRVKLGAQNVSLEDEGAHTGAVTVHMLLDAGAQYVIIGHSERRAEHETNEEVGKKAKHALAAGLDVVLCVGEPEAIRKQGIEAALAFVTTELAESAPSAEHMARSKGQLAIAYEPVWAISKDGVGRTDTAENAAAMATVIKAFLAQQLPDHAPLVLYGGSLNSGNAAQFLAKPEIGGALVGHASMNAEEFQKIIDAAGSK